jgi:RNA polymerase-binding transcription factor
VVDDAAQSDPEATVPRPDATVRHLEARLAQAKALIHRRKAELAAAAADVDLAGRDDEHDPDGATAAFDHALAAGLLTRAEAEAEAIGAALARLGDGSYGVCVVCARPIGRERLTALPSADRCVQCAEYIKREASPLTLRQAPATATW